MYLCIPTTQKKVLDPLGLELDSPRLLGMDSGNSIQILIGAFNHWAVSPAETFFNVVS